MSSTIALNICAIIAKIKRYKSIFKKKKNKHDEITLLTRAHLYCIKGSFSKCLTPSHIEHDFFLPIDLLKECYDRKSQ